MANDPSSHRASSCAVWQGLHAPEASGSGETGLVAECGAPPPTRGLMAGRGGGCWIAPESRLQLCGGVLRALQQSRAAAGRTERQQLLLPVQLLLSSHCCMPSNRTVPATCERTCSIMNRKPCAAMPFHAMLDHVCHLLTPSSSYHQPPPTAYQWRPQRFNMQHTNCHWSAYRASTLSNMTRLQRTQDTAPDTKLIPTQSLATADHHALTGPHQHQQNGRPQQDD
jgi:hypothetical protein